MPVYWVAVCGYQLWRDSHATEIGTAVCLPFERELQVCVEKVDPDIFRERLLCEVCASLL